MKLKVPIIDLSDRDEGKVPHEIMDASRGRQRSERLRRLSGFQRVWLWLESLKHTPCSEEKVQQILSDDYRKPS
uniref:Uncharacterized protein n=1 Tax=Lotus japonicus TaxID=34305 RepID=I3SVW6_LOTJA|nr:unknown [Lotus japonicus]